MIAMFILLTFVIYGIMAKYVLGNVFKSRNRSAVKESVANTSKTTELLKPLHTSR
ncbi:hypothetical protein JOC86_000821 [Bacillus pakistanensis]|uniref:ATP synthase F0 subunit 8 n=2 Tax=Rossellomorea pakistanensis TaxID=992288 RepID=A0ABS2N946_9BACI|nr:hypothetical protein [Bacillus pakistanensis]